jgi:glycosyltransferase involved in cell wall biosynthesis
MSEQVRSVPDVSIIMAAYQAAATISESIESVIVQTRQNWELIIVDDASADNTGEIIQAYAEKDRRIRVFANDTNKGVAAARNFGIKQASGRYLAFLDSDDLWHRDKLEKQLPLMEKAVISYTATSYINKAGQVSGYTLHAEERLEYSELLRRNIMSCSSVMVRRDSMIEFPQGYMHEDYAVWLQIVKKAGQACGLDEPLLIYRMGGESKSAKRMNSALMTRNTYMHIGYGRIVSFALMLRYALHSIFKRLRINQRISATIKSYVYTKLLPLIKHSPPLKMNVSEGNGESIAAICDPMTWRNLCQDEAVIALTPSRWRDAFKASKIKFFFCEAAWSGTDGACWRGQIYKDGRVLYENRHKLISILKRCKADKIPTVFWAKEDPVYFRDSVYNFTDTALKFDFIFTTAEECIPKYKKLGHKHVYLLPFGFSPVIYHPPLNKKPRENIAVFAGSWFPEHPKRCADLTEIFDMVLSFGIPLRIYDRNRINGHSSKPFPERYQAYVCDSISYEDLGGVYRSAEYAVNVNTVSTSETMFARRVYEAMASGAIVISNESSGMEKQFADGNVWYVGRGFDFKSAERIREENIENVFANHTWEERMKKIHETVLKGRG